MLYDQHNDPTGINYQDNQMFGLGILLLLKQN